MIVSLSLLHPKGANIAGKYWPHSGHLGLTPLALNGVVRVRTDSSSSSSFNTSTPATALTSGSGGASGAGSRSGGHPASGSSASSASASASHSSSSSSSASSSNASSSTAPTSSSGSTSGSGNGSGRLRASALTVSLVCYEARLGRVGVVKTNILFEHVVALWSSSSPSTSSSSSHPSSSTSAHYPSSSSTPHSSNTNTYSGGANGASTSELPQTDFPFNLIVPPSAVTASGACSMSHFQNYRVYWRLEASELLSPVYLLLHVILHVIMIILFWSPMALVGRFCHACDWRWLLSAVLYATLHAYVHGRSPYFPLFAIRLSIPYLS